MVKIIQGSLPALGILSIIQASSLTTSCLAMEGCGTPPVASCSSGGHRRLEWIEGLQTRVLQALAAYALEASPENLCRNPEASPLQFTPDPKSYHDNMKVLIKLALDLDTEVPSDFETVSAEELRKTPHRLVDKCNLATILSRSRRTTFKNRLEELVYLRQARKEQDIWYEYILEHTDDMEEQKRSLILSDPAPVELKLILLIHSIPESRNEFIGICSVLENAADRVISRQDSVVTVLFESIWSTVYFGTYGTLQVLHTLKTAVNTHSRPLQAGSTASKKRRRQSVAFAPVLTNSSEAYPKEDIPQVLLFAYQNNDEQGYMEYAQMQLSSLLIQKQDPDKTLENLTTLLETCSLGQEDQRKCLNLTARALRDTVRKIATSCKVNAVSPDQSINSIDQLGERISSNISKGKDRSQQTMILREAKHELVQEMIISATDRTSTIHKRGQPNRPNVALANFKQFIADNEIDNAKTLANDTTRTEILERMHEHALRENRKSLAEYVKAQISATASLAFYASGAKR